MSPMECPSRIESVNLALSLEPSRPGGELTGIGKTATTGPVRLSAPGPRGVGGSGLAGDHIASLEHHGGDDQAVYAYAREDLDWWSTELGRSLPAGAFGENLTVRGVDVTGARVGELWRVGPAAVLQVTSPRIPCQKFAERIGAPHWVKRFTERGVSGTYLRVVAPGPVTADDPVELLERPGHDVTVGRYFRALTTERHLLPAILAIVGD